MSRGSITTAPGSANALDWYLFGVFFIVVFSVYSSNLALVMVIVYLVVIITAQLSFLLPIRFFFDASLHLHILDVGFVHQGFDER